MIPAVRIVTAAAAPSHAVAANDLVLDATHRQHPELRNDPNQQA
jgi:hypothetical protein